MSFAGHEELVSRCTEIADGRLRVFKYFRLDLGPISLPFKRGQLYLNAVNQPHLQSF
jgi:hypothetical protein